ncbi:MAG: SDR family oxidoreductase [Candidatus Thermoplasmatota archaeon]|nr:SDR family oxidoreductase [Candidatus Thermoplasmatota archaeon]
MVYLKDLGESLALITGGSSGIGLATARMLTSRGCRVILLARDQEKLLNAASGIDGVIGTYVADVSDKEAVSGVSKRIFGDHGVPNILVNSAGIVYPGILSELTMEQIDTIIDIDLKGTIYVCKTFSPMMRPPGHIVNISSMAGIIGLYGYTAYSAAKFGVRGFSEALRMELNTKGIGVSIVFPPDTETPQLRDEELSKPEELKAISNTIRTIQPEKVARAVIGAIISGEFLVFPDASSRATYHANRFAGPIVRKVLDGKVKGSSKDHERGDRAG